MSDQPAWWEIEEPEYSQVWDDVNLTFNFNPSIFPRDWPGFREPVPSVTYALSTEWDAASSEEFLALMKGHIRTCARPDEWVYGLDPHHTCCRYNPHLLEEPAPDALGCRDPWTGSSCRMGTMASRWLTIGGGGRWAIPGRRAFVYSGSP